MNLFIIHAHTSNRGDEAAVRAMLDEIHLKYPKANITISLQGMTKYPNLKKEMCQIERFPQFLKGEKNRLTGETILTIVDFFLILVSKGRIVLKKTSKNFISTLNKADLVIHAPGGPSIGDIYQKAEKRYLWVLELIRKKNIPYMFYAPSMGPFYNKKRNHLRKKVLSGARKIIVRDPISLAYLKELLPDIDVCLAMDSALQNDINIEDNEKKLIQYKDLNAFIKEHKRCIGMTITDLKWHPKHKNNPHSQVITNVFDKFITNRIKEGYGIVFIPQLYGTLKPDSILMRRFMRTEHTFMVQDNSDLYDSYFQQYLIGRLYAVVGMRYHSNIFSAKMGIPFISISYEQKMKGFVEKIGLSEFCIDIDDLYIANLEEKFETLTGNYDEYKKKLRDLHDVMKAEAYRSTETVIEILENNVQRGLYE